MHVAQGESGVDAAVVEFDPLPNPVGAAAENHHLVGIGGNLHRVRSVVARIVVGGVFDPADRHGVPALDDAGLGPPVAEVAFRQAENLGQIGVGKALLLGEFQQFERQFLALVAQDFLFARYQFLHLFQEPAVDGGTTVQFLHRRPLAQGLVEHELPFAGRRRQPRH